MDERPERGQPATQASEDFEWVNAWAEMARATPLMPVAAEAAACAWPLAMLASDIEAIARARDALIAAERERAEWQAWRAPVPRLRRTGDSVPVVLGSVLGLLILVVFATAAAFGTLAR